MKKLVSAMSLLLGLGLATAQQTHPATATPPAKVLKVDNHKKPMPAQAQYDKKTKTVSTHSAVGATTTKTKTVVKAQPGVVLKKDGTPDRRYKANQHLKKDGTVDKRFKH